MLEQQCKLALKLAVKYKPESSQTEKKEEMLAKQNKIIANIGETKSKKKNLWAPNTVTISF